VNIPKLMLEAKAANVAEHGLSRADWVLARTESFAAFGSSFAFVVNSPARQLRRALAAGEAVPHFTAATVAGLCGAQLPAAGRAGAA